MGVSFADRVVTVHPFTYRIDGDEAIIVNASGTSFLAIPEPALGLLQDLAGGGTMETARARFAERTGETPDLEDFLELLTSEGFVSLDDDRQSANATRSPNQASTARPARSHFESLSPEMARRILSWPTLVVSGLLIVAAGLAVSREPTLVPPPTALVFATHLTLLSVAVFAFISGSIFLHELAHLVAARAAGSTARLAISHRLWFLVAETDLSGVWLASRRQRYLAFLAGPLLDATLAAAFILVLWSDRRAGWLDPFALVLIRAFLFTCMVRLLWQCYFFVRTDLYYVIATYFNCKNLMEDTETWLRNQLARVWNRLTPVDQSAIPSAELRVIRCYAAVWLIGRAVAFGSLIVITVPILWSYLVELIPLFMGQRATTGSRVDAGVWIGITLAIEGTGLFLWLRGLYRAHLSARLRLSELLRLHGRLPGNA